MFNPKKVVSLFVVAAALFVFADPSYAANNAKNSKVAKKQMKKVKLQFDPNVYYKLSHKRRLEYLKVFMDLAVNLETVMGNQKKSAMHDYYQELNEILFPRAEASYNGVCLNGGIFFEHEGACPSTIPESLRFANLAPYYNCGQERRCSVHAGFDANGQGFCYSSAKNATAECKQKSESANGRTNLNAVLSNCAVNQAKCDAFRSAMIAESAKSGKYCDTAERQAKSYCQAAQAMLGSFSTDTDGSFSGPVPSASMLDSRSGCTEAHAQALSGDSFGSLQRQMNFPSGVDNYWMYLSMVAQTACGTYRDQADVLKVVGLCSAPSSSVDDCSSQKENLAKCARDLFNVSVVEFAKQVAQADPTVCAPVYEGGNLKGNCVGENNAFKIRNRLVDGNLTGLEKVAKALCPTQAPAYSTCRASHPVKSVAVSNPTNVEHFLSDEKRNNALSAIQALISGVKEEDLSEQQKRGFADTFGMRTLDFRTMFCQTTAEGFVIGRKDVLKRSGGFGGEMGARMRACANNSVSYVKQNNGTEVPQSNYARRSCSAVPVAKVASNTINDYLYYETETGYCRKSTGIVKGADLPKDGRIIAPCNDSSSADSSRKASLEYVRLEVAKTATSDEYPVYACIDTLTTVKTEKTNLPVLQVSRASCSASGDNGDGPDSPNVGQ